MHYHWPHLRKVFANENSPTLRFGLVNDYRHYVRRPTQKVSTEWGSNATVFELRIGNIIKFWTNKLYIMLDKVQIPLLPILYRILI